MILRTIKCDVCGATETELQSNSGWPGWGSLNGIGLNGTDNPCLCPVHLASVADFVDRMCEAPK